MSPSSQGDIGLARVMSCWALGQSLGVAGGFLRRISPCRHCVDYSVLFCLLRDVHLVAYTIYIYYFSFNMSGVNVMLAGL